MFNHGSCLASSALGELGWSRALSAWRHPWKPTHTTEEGRGKNSTSETERRSSRSKQEVEESTKLLPPCVTKTQQRGRRRSARPVVVTGRILDSFKFQEITAGCLESACFSEQLKETAHETLLKKVLCFTPPPSPFRSSSRRCFPFPPLSTALPSQRQTGSAQREAKEWRGRAGREDRAGKQQAMKQNVRERGFRETSSGFSWN